jgi:hypothetical protein
MCVDVRMYFRQTKYRAKFLQTATLTEQSGKCLACVKENSWQEYLVKNHEQAFSKMVILSRILPTYCTVYTVHSDSTEVLLFPRWSAQFLDLATSTAPVCNNIFNTNNINSIVNTTNINNIDICQYDLDQRASILSTAVTTPTALSTTSTQQQQCGTA